MDQIPRNTKKSPAKHSKLSKTKQNFNFNHRFSKEKQEEKIKVYVTGYDSRRSKFAVIFQKNSPMSEVKLAISQKLKNLHINTQSIIGFESENSDFAFDYKFELGIGSLGVDTKLRCFHYENHQGLQKYKICCCLAVGGFSKVFLVRSKESGKFFAAKFIDISKHVSNSQLLQNEKSVSLQLDSPFLVKTYEFHETSQFSVFIMDYCPGGELFYLLKHIKYMSEDEARTCFIQVLLGIQYLHNAGYMYRDLKPENILLDCFGFLKIADFGLAKTHSQKSYSFCGSIEYMAPEILRGKGHQKLVDFYCLGALLYQMLIGHPPFYDNDSSTEQTKKKILNSKIDFLNKNRISPLAQDLIVKLTQKNEKQRLGYFGGCRQIMAHPWVGKINRKFFQQKKFKPPFPVSLDKLNFDPEEIGRSERIFEERIIFAISSKTKTHLVSCQKNLYLVRKNNSLSQRLTSKKSRSPYKNKSLLNFSQNKAKSPYQYILKKIRSGKTLKTEQNEQFRSGWVQKKFNKNMRWTQKSQQAGKQNKLTKVSSKLRKKCALVPFSKVVKTQISPGKREIFQWKNKDSLPSFSNQLF